MGIQTIDEYRNMSKYLSKLSRYGLAKFTPLIVTCAITGGNQGKEANPNLPETLEEQVQQTYDAYNAGASIVHIHRRDPKNNSTVTGNWKDYQEVNARIREKCPDLIINNTVGGGRLRLNDNLTSGNLLTVAIQAKPEIASLDISNYSIRKVVKKRPEPLDGLKEDQLLEMSYTIMPSEAEKVLTMMQENGCMPEYECFDIGDLLYLNGFIASGKVPKEGPHLVQMVYGGANFPTVDYMQTVIKHLPENCIYGTIATGAAQWPMLAASIILGGHVRVGMEDNIYLEKGRLAKSNAELVEKIVRIATELGRPIATPAQAREILGLGEPRQYEVENS